MDDAASDRIKEAREMFGLGDTATIGEIRSAYKQLAKGGHPDTGGTDEEMKRINEAYALLMSYCEEFPIPLRREDAAGQDEEYDFLVNRFFENFFL